jgi:predicted anti-sigma-YlaC factor YlaD
VNPANHNPHANDNAHERARKLIALAGPEAIFAPDPLSGQLSSNAWLAAHLETCASCRAFAENAAETIHGLRSIPIAAQRALVSTTQMRVRRRALELQRRRERLWLVSVSCTAVTLCALVSTLALWRGFAWLGARAQLPSSIWGVAFLVFCFIPALVAAILLLARDRDKDRDRDGDKEKRLPYRAASYQN